MQHLPCKRQHQGHFQGDDPGPFVTRSILQMLLLMMMVNLRWLSWGLSECLSRPIQTLLHERRGCQWWWWWRRRSKRALKAVKFLGLMREGNGKACVREQPLNLPFCVCVFFSKKGALLKPQGDGVSDSLISWDYSKTLQEILCSSQSLLYFCKLQ